MAIFGPSRKGVERITGDHHISLVSEDLTIPIHGLAACFRCPDEGYGCDDCAVKQIKDGSPTVRNFRFQEASLDLKDLHGSRLT